jgi:hypothetical protein
MNATKKWVEANALARGAEEAKERLLSEARKALGYDLQLFRAFEGIIDAAFNEGDR